MLGGGGVHLRFSIGTRPASDERAVALCLVGLIVVEDVLLLPVFDHLYVERGLTKCNFVALLALLYLSARAVGARPLAVVLAALE